MQDQIDLLLRDVAYYTNKIERTQAKINKHFVAQNMPKLSASIAREQYRLTYWKQKMRDAMSKVRELRAIENDYVQCNPLICKNSCIELLTACDKCKDEYNKWAQSNPRYVAFNVEGFQQAKKDLQATLLETENERCNGQG